MKVWLIILFIYSAGALGRSILIDPGHGGEDLGANKLYQILGKNREVKNRAIKEKDIALKISKLIYKKLKKLNFDAYLTRSIDRTVSLHERAEMADKLKVDLFVSVHVNSSRKSFSNGFETYYLDNNKDQAVNKLEKVENHGISEQDMEINKILFDLVIKRTVKHSKNLANTVHSKIAKNIQTKFKMKDRGVKPGLFYVLALSKRPGILLEVGFISNPREWKKINNSDFQELYADAVVGGVKQYFEKFHPKNAPALF
ncbi:MAG: N-acetylmuramoyl-L-alanine amidase family protein [Bacteriovoracaceae bacterium]